MNRLSFLKKLSVGIAAAVITPKVLAEVDPSPKETPKDKEWGIKWAKEVYGHYEEDRMRYTVDQLCMYDICIDKDSRAWMVTMPPSEVIELTALLADPLPNKIDVKRGSFDEYFIIMGNCFMPGTGGPQ